MFRSSSEHPKEIYVEEAYIKHRQIIRHIKILIYLIIRLCQCRLRIVCHVDIIICHVNMIVCHVNTIICHANIIMPCKYNSVM